MRDFSYPSFLKKIKESKKEPVPTHTSDLISRLQVPYVPTFLFSFPQGCGGWEHCLDTHASTGSAPLVWFGAWNQTMQPKLDRLLATSREQQEGWSKDNGK